MYLVTLPFSNGDKSPLYEAIPSPWVRFFAGGTRGLLAFLPCPSGASHSLSFQLVLLSSSSRGEGHRRASRAHERSSCRTRRPPIRHRTRRCRAPPNHLPNASRSGEKRSGELPSLLVLDLPQYLLIESAPLNPARGGVSCRLSFCLVPDSADSVQQAIFQTGWLVRA